ncbi:VTC domain-containing protein [Cellulomonas denverensis]|nr:VTC domain-containing protein [Cellulomonas denverensis]
MGPVTAVQELAPVTLEELVADSALLTRVDRKYVLPADALTGLIAALPPGTRRLTIDGRDDFGYRSVYLDTPELDAFHAAAGRRRRRYKVRTRSYLDSGGCWLEVKTRGPRGRTVKCRREHPDPGSVGAGLPFVRAALSDAGIPQPARLDLAPVLVTAYRRSTLHLPDGSRATLDTELCWSAPGGGPRVALPGRLIVETKSEHGAGALDRVLWRAGHRPERISKYATGLLLLHPDLTGRPWRRTLRRALTPGDTPCAARSAH